ncbi:BgTH12-01781 [Blumeria graminis f. sp. triticale]|uniref:BgTH12-01781 n=1 Tax=Blumeria graminis f. sp. triticale TaxID=1689686 RepID=A0A9W4CZR5_BLUGR|nr:BgTH12-01781 [Blumeria graminis f. sp. triticale]
MSASPARESFIPPGSTNGSAEERPRLSENEKKANHIASAEQKRRQAIREGFDRLTELVPGLEGQGRSESVVLKKTVDYIRSQLAERKCLVKRIEELGGHAEEELED